MANFTQTITFTVNCFGMGPASLWGTLYWEADATGEWGEGSTVMAFGYGRPITNTISPTEDMSAESMQTSNGYYYVFRKPSTNAEDRALPSYTSGTI